MTLNPADFVQPARQLSARLVSGQGHAEAVIPAVLGARCSVWIATANLKDLWIEKAAGWTARPTRKRGGYRSVLEAFDELAEQGVELRVLHAKAPSRAFRRSFDRFPRLYKGGLALRLCPRVHLKLVIVDGAFVYLGSANWTGAGLGAKGGERRNFELGITSEDARLLDATQALYDQIWRGELCPGCRVRERCEDPLDLIG